MNYHPDRWVIIKIETPKETLYKVFGSWSGGYAKSDYWKLNSGIEKIYENDENFYIFLGYSGSEYICSKNSYGVVYTLSGALNSIIEQSCDKGKITLLTKEEAEDYILKFN